ncbi:hypothetical protein WN66_05952 [Saccharomyces cerevisiae]|nr:hypothetical protein WN66_05952 [Saccharomyces cerevisiae]
MFNLSTYYNHTRNTQKQLLEYFERRPIWMYNPFFALFLRYVIDSFKVLSRQSKYFPVRYDSIGIHRFWQDNITSLDVPANNNVSGLNVIFLRNFKDNRFLQ